MSESRESLPFCSALTSVNTRPKEHQNLERTSFMTVLYSNVRGLHQARGDLCKTCSEHRPAIVCLTETHLRDDATDSFCPQDYVVAARRDRTKHGGGVLILVQETVLFEEIDTSIIAIPEKAELVAVSCYDTLFICCYRQPSSTDTTLLTCLDNLLDKYGSMPPVICGDFNVHESSWLHSTHTSSAGTATLDFCESRNLHQLIDFSIRCNAILDLILSEHLGLVQKLPNLNTSDHVAILLTLESLSIPITTPPDRRVFHWCRAPWNRLRRYFSSYRWDFPESVESSVAYFTNVIILATRKFVPSCVPRLCRPTPWWNRHCETAWRRKMKFWHSADNDGFHQASLTAAHVYSLAIQNYQARLRKTLGDCTVSKQWWSLLTSITGRSSKGKPAVPPSAKLADYFSSKLSHSSLLDTPPVLEDCHYLLFRQFRIKKSQVRSVLLSLDVNKSIGDDGLSPQILKSCAQLLSGPLTSLFCRICQQSLFPASWKISRITPVFKKGSRSDPTCYCPIAVLPTLSRVFERLLAPQL